MAPFRLLLVGLGNRGTMWSEVITSLPDAVIAGAMDIEDRSARDVSRQVPGGAPLS